MLKRADVWRRLKRRTCKNRLSHFIFSFTPDHGNRMEEDWKRDWRDDREDGEDGEKGEHEEQEKREGGEREVMHRVQQKTCEEMK